MPEYNEAKQLELTRGEGRAEGASEQAQRAAINLYKLSMNASDIAAFLEQTQGKARKRLCAATL